jgi:hypothetical protein
MDGITALERSRSLWASKSHWSEHSVIDQGIAPG